jgi:hypothetical protein
MAQHPAPTGDGRGGQLCPWCGAPNPAGLQRCVSCGAWLRGDSGDGTNGETIIDVSGDAPRIIGEEPQPQAQTSGGFSSVWYSSGRGLVVRGGRRGCIIAAIVVLLLICSQCLLAWLVLRWIF